MSTLLSEDLTADRNAALALFTSDPTSLSRPYAPGKWSGREVLIHLTDSNSVLLDRLRRLQADAKPLLWSFDPDAWRQHLAYERRDLTIAASLFTATINSIIELASLVPAERYERTGVHNELGKKSFAEVLGFIHLHNVHHFGQVQAAIEGRTWTAQEQTPLSAYYGQP